MGTPLEQVTAEFGAIKTDRSNRVRGQGPEAAN